MPLRITAIFISFAIVLSVCPPSYTQELPHREPHSWSKDQDPPFAENEDSAKTSSGEDLLQPPASKDFNGQSALPLKVFVREIQIVGCSVFKKEELLKITDGYTNRELTSEDLEEIRRALTMLYVQHGFVNSGAVIPDQPMDDGILIIQVIEGQLTSVEVKENRWFRDEYIEKRIVLEVGKPLNISKLQENLLLLNQDSRIEKVNAVLRPGVQPGQSLLHVTVKEKNPFWLLLDYNNYIPPTVGSEEGLLTAAHQNLTGRGDILSATYGRSSGIDPHLEANYSLPVSANDTILSFFLKNNDYAVVGKDFEPLDIKSTSDLIGVSIVHPLRRTLASELKFGIVGERIKNESFLLGVPYSFTPGAEDGESVVTALRFSLDWLTRTRSKVINVYSRLSLGVDAFGSTNNSSDIPDSQFLSGLIQFKWAQLLQGLGDIETVLRSDLQVASEHLLPVEQIAVGGRYSVRGYRENLLVRDNAWINSLEARVPLIRNRSWADYFQVTAFADAGTSWNTDVSTPEPRTLSSVGLGLRWGVTVPGKVPLRPEFEFYKGFPLEDVEVSDDDIQDDGIHFRLTTRIF